MIQNQDEPIPGPISNDNVEIKQAGSEPGSLEETRQTVIDTSLESGEETRPNLIDTGPNTAEEVPLVPITEPESSGGSAEPTRTNTAASWILISLLAVFTLLVIAGMSAYGGYHSGVIQRRTQEAYEIAGQLTDQFLLGLDDMEAGHDDLARQRFEWVIEHDPNFPGAIDKLVELQTRMGITASPTPAPTPTLTPTPDTRGRDELYNAGRQALASGEWTNAIETLLKLRKIAPDFHTVQVDGWLYIALRYRGVDKIKAADLEGGTYDLALAERFGPLDVEATNYRSWAEMYVTGASFWDIDWAQTVNYFEQLIIIAPYLRDGSGWTSTDRYKLALSKYGDWLAQQERWCEAQEQYQKAIDLGSNQVAEPTAVYASEQCTASQEPEIVETPQPSVEETPVIVLPTPEQPQGETTPSPEPTPIDSDPYPSTP